MDNLFSAYKLYAQGIYSKILISLLNEGTRDPETLCKDSISTIISDRTIKMAVPESILNNKKNISVLDSRVFDLELEIINYELQRFFEDYVPSDLNREYVIEGTEAHNGESLRELLVRDFKGIFSEEIKLYEKLMRDNDLYERISYRRNFFSYYELELINKYFYQIDCNDGNYSLLDKIQLIENNTPELSQNLKWLEIIEKAKEYYPTSLENYGKEIQYEDSLEATLNDSGQIQQLIRLFNLHFKGENQFLSNLEYDIHLIDEFNVKDFLKNLKGSQDHPWARFWTVYNRNSEIHLYTQKQGFTNAMNAIETQMKKAIQK